MTALKIATPGLPANPADGFMAKFTSAILHKVGGRSDKPATQSVTDSLGTLLDEASHTWTTHLGTAQAQMR